MNFRQYLFALLLVTIFVIVLYSCKDIGINPPVKSGLTASATNIFVVKGNSSQITLSNGLLPYSIRKQPNNAIATASLIATELTISGVDTGNTSVIVADSKTPIADSLEILISIMESSLPVSFSNQIQPIFNSRCVSCHGSNGGLSLVAGTSYNHLVNVQAQSSCISLKRVLPYDAANSVLYSKVSGTSCGNRMPLGGILNAGDIALIQDWINQGANNN